MCRAEKGDVVGGRTSFRGRASGRPATDLPTYHKGSRREGGGGADGRGRGSKAQWQAFGARSGPDHRGGAGRRTALEHRQRPRGELEPLSGGEDHHPAHRHRTGRRHPQPVHRILGHLVRDLPPELRHARRLQPQRLRATPRARHELAGLARRQDLDLPHPPRRDLAGRRAADGKRRRLYLQLHHQERPVRFHPATRPTSSRRSLSTPTRSSFHPRQAQGRHAAPCGCRIVPQHVWSKVSGKAAPDHVRQPGADRRLGSVPGGRGQEGQTTSALVANKHYWGGAPKVDEVIFQVYQNAETMVAGPEGRQHPGEPSTFRSPSSTGSPRRPA